VNSAFRVDNYKDDIETAVCWKAAGQIPTKPDYGRNGIRHMGGRSLGEATTRIVRTFGVDANGKAASEMNHKGERTDATPRDAYGWVGDRRGVVRRFLFELLRPGATERG
jgi:hypothetical protein